MWKYVSRRVKETFERSYVLDVGKSWACGAPSQDLRVQSAANFGQQANLGADDYVCVALPTTHGGRSDVTYYRCEKFTSSSRGKGRRGHYRRGCVVGDLLGAITWSGAIICGWYASQLLCLHRRHAGWENPRYMQILNIPTRAFHSNLLSHCVLASPNYPSLVSERTLHDKFAAANLPSKPRAAIFDVNNDNECGDRVPTCDEPQKQQNVDDAVADLVTFLGETEYKMGVKSLSAGQYRSAVAHLKLATSHNHPGATFNLGLCYEKGLGVAKNLKRAMECYQLASSMGHSKAMYNLGVFYARGLGGLEKDRQAAKQCFITAAKLGQPEAIDALGVRAERPNIHPSVGTDFPPMTELLFEKSKAKLYAAAAKFT